MHSDTVAPLSVPGGPFMRPPVIGALWLGQCLLLCCGNPGATSVSAEEATAGQVVSQASSALSSAPLQRENYSFQLNEHFTNSDCGAPIDIDYVAEGSGVFMLKAGHEDPTPSYFDNYRLVESFTNTANHETLTVVHQGLFTWHRIEHIEGNIYRLTTQETGRPVVVYGPDGQRSLFDRGLVRVTWLVDTKGDSDPFNDEFLEQLGSQTAGPHPVFDGADFCDALNLIR